MKRIISALSVLACATVLGLVGCGGDDDGDGNAGTAGKGNEPTAGSGNEPTAGAPNEGENVPCDPDEETTCQNATDCQFVADGSARSSAQTCGRGQCLAAEDATCASECIRETLDMSEECASCYAEFVLCTRINCLSACISDPNAEGCTTCQVEKGCRAEFNTCSGLPE
ncbi:MAG: hypothetical protein K0R38_3079 [Polyangiaceae bacterium]|jgi:hypothetical protein|nr:hypothetical protein [Polyangiaceae bacterium]